TDAVTVLAWAPALDTDSLTFCAALDAAAPAAPDPHALTSSAMLPSVSVAVRSAMSLLAVTRDVSRQSDLPRARGISSVSVIATSEGFGRCPVPHWRGRVLCRGAAPPGRVRASAKLTEMCR